MPRSDVDTPRLVEGDRVVDDRGNRGVVRQCFNRTARTYFLAVFILEGPKAWTWGSLASFRREGSNLFDTREA